MKKETYFCDKCKKESLKDDLFTVSVKWHAHGWSHHAEEVRASDLCVNCCAKRGLIKKVIENDKIVNEPQTLQDRLFDVLTDIIHETHGEADHD